MKMTPQEIDAMFQAGLDHYEATGEPDFTAIRATFTRLTAVNLQLLQLSQTAMAQRDTYKAVAADICDSFLNIVDARHKNDPDLLLAVVDAMTAKHVRETKITTETTTETPPQGAVFH